MIHLALNGPDLAALLTLAKPRTEIGNRIKNSSESVLLCNLEESTDTSPWLFAPVFGKEMARRFELYSNLLS